jgi:lysyl-tRNA synthetase class 2
MALSEQEILREKHSQNYANWNRSLSANRFITTIFSDILADFENTKLILGTFDGKAYYGKASFAELKDAEGTYQIYVSRDDISDDEEKK